MVLEIIFLEQCHISYMGIQNSHGIIRAAEIQFLRDNPERFIDSNLERSWI